MKQEQGLSEVIGFLMIIALLGILFSMYLLYIVPLQGRDSEISHMNKVKEQFTGITLDINSLIVNEKLNYPIQRVISLGSGQEGSTGALSIFPVQSYFGSSGTLSVDSRDPNPELGKITFTLRGTGVKKTENVEENDIEYKYDDKKELGSSGIVIKPQRFILNYHVDDTQVTNSDIITISSEPDWSVIARVINRYDKNYVNITNDDDIPGDLTITVLKEGKKTIDNLSVHQYVEKNTNYSINLYDWTYGLADVLGKTYNVTYSTNGVNGGDPLSIGQVKYPEIPLQEVKTNYDFQRTHPLSMFSFQSNNKYWINQEYQYQWGATFVNQTEGTALTFLPPVNIKKKDGIIHIDLTDTIIETHSAGNPQVSISSTQNNPVIIKLLNLSETINDYELLDGAPNAKYLIITASGFANVEDRDKWRSVFTTICEKAKYENSNGITTRNITVTDKPLDSTHTGPSLFIAWDDDPAGFDLTNIVNDDAYPTLQDVIDEFDDDNGIWDIDQNYLKISYKRADISFSLYNLGQ
ncbi:MAG TPA: hypothetical protein PLG55_06955 [Methanospirillum sp.]|uniref:hypothetical protein n=1 Tax=Methanospirillum sp. TaxID=45200 RepID=UPI002BD0AFAD|nr:hypothetical protein [Methanospirillum sp.]HPY60443.1 hypothetical protein [Methanospirillum sp.]